MGVHFDRPPVNPPDPHVLDRMVEAQERTAKALERLVGLLEEATAQDGNKRGLIVRARIFDR